MIRRFDYDLRLGWHPPENGSSALSNRSLRTHAIWLLSALTLACGAPASEGGTVEEKAASAGGVEPGEYLRQSALPTTVSTDDRIDVTALEFDGYVR